MKTSRQNHLKVPIITFLVCVIKVNGANLIITQDPLHPNVSTSASLTCHIPSFTGGAEWLINGLPLTLCQTSICLPPSSTRYQYSANATAMTVKITSVDIALDDTTWTCSHNTGADIGYSNLTVYKLPSDLDINGTNSTTIDKGDTVILSVSTGCIHPSGSAYYAVIWKYVQANSSAETNFGTNIKQTVTSVGGCQNTYEDNLMFSLFLTNDMNTGNTTISISQVKMTFTMAGINFYATKSVAYTVTSDGTAAPANKTEDGPPQCKLELGLGLGLGLGIPMVITIIVVVIFIYTGTNDEDNPQETDGKKHEQIPLEPTEVSSVQTYVGSKANFNFMLTEDCNESKVHIKNKSGGVVMTAHGMKGSSDDPVYKGRVNFTGNTNQKLISFILRNVTLSDAGIYIAVHSDANRIIGCQMLIAKGCKRPYILGLVLGLGLGITFIVGCIIIAILISTGTTSCNLEFGLALGLSLGMSCVIAIIIAVIFICKGIPNKHEFGEGILVGFVIGIIVKRLKWKKHEQVRLEPTDVSSIQTHVGSEANFNFMLTEDSNESEVHIKNKSGGVVMIAHGKKGRSDDPVYKGRVNFTGNTNQKLISFILRNVTLSDAGIYIADIAVHSDANRIIGCQKLIVKDTKGKTKNPGSSAVSREQVQVQLEIKGFKDDEEERPPAVHTGTQNKVDPSKQTKDRQQPVPPANTGFEDNPTFRPLPPPPQKGEIKDRNVRGISATIGDTQDLASETPRPNKLPPIPLKQETVQEENVSEEPKKKRKKKKKMNVETPEEENGETDMRVI